MDYIIKQRINSPHTIPSFDEKHIDDYSSIYIANDGHLYGVLDDNNTVIIPFEYDNITLIQASLLQLVKGGKLGLARIDREFNKEFQPIEVIRIIPCEFDSIVTPKHNYIVILKKDEAVGMSVRAYFTSVDELTDWYSNYIILGRNIVELSNSDGNYLYDNKGKMFLHHQNQACIAFDVPFKDEDEKDYYEFGRRGIVVFADSHRTNNSSKDSLIYYNGKRARQYFFKGEIHPIYKVTDCENGPRPIVDRFIIEEDGNMVLLSADCNRIRTGDLAQIKVETRIETYSKDTNRTVVYPYSSKTYQSELELHEFFNECCDLLGSDFEKDDYE